MKSIQKLYWAIDSIGAMGGEDSEAVRYIREFIVDNSAVASKPLDPYAWLAKGKDVREEYLGVLHDDNTEMAVGLDGYCLLASASDYRPNFAGTSRDKYGNQTRALRARWEPLLTLNAPTVNILPVDTIKQVAKEAKVVLKEKKFLYAWVKVVDRGDLHESTWIDVNHVPKLLALDKLGYGWRNRNKTSAMTTGDPMLTDYAGVIMNVNYPDELDVLEADPGGFWVITNKH